MCSSENRNSNYEFIAYDQPQQSQPQQPDRPIIYFKAKQPAHPMTEPQFQSTQLHEPIEEKRNRISSTMLKTSAMSLVSSDFEPNLSKISENAHLSQPRPHNQQQQQSKAFSNDSCSLSVTYTDITVSSHFSSDYSSSQYSASSFDSVSSEDYHLEQTLYVCCVEYKARIQGDLTLNFADRVKLIHMNAEHCLVENILTRQCGYVPRYCVATMEQFLRQVKYLNRR